MKTKIRIFESGKADGIMSINKKFYSENTTEEEIKEKFLKVREKLGKNMDSMVKRLFKLVKKMK